MNTSGKKNLFLTTLLLATMLSSCGKATENPGKGKEPANEVELQTSTSVAVEETGEPQETDDLLNEDNGSGSEIVELLPCGVQVEAQVLIGSGIDLNALSIYSAVKQEVDVAQAKQILLEDKTIEAENDSSTAEYYYCTTADDFTLVASEGSLIYQGKTADMANTLIDTESQAGTQSRFLTGADLSFTSMDSAEAQVRETLEELNISVFGTPVCYTMDQAGLQEEAEKYNASIAEFFSLEEETAEEESTVFFTVSADDECYLFVWTQAVDGMPLSSEESGSYGDGSWLPGTELRCVVSAEGVVGISYNYQFEISGVKESGQVGLTVEDILEKVNDKYENMILDGDYLVDQILFAYVPQSVEGDGVHYTLLPAWCVSVAHSYETEEKDEGSSTETVTERTKLWFNALTAEELLMDVGDA